MTLSYFGIIQSKHCTVVIQRDRLNTVPKEKSLNFVQNMNSQKILHSSPLRASYVVCFLSFCRKDIMKYPECIVLWFSRGVLSWWKRNWCATWWPVHGTDYTVNIGGCWTVYTNHALNIPGSVRCHFTGCWKHFSWLWCDNGPRDVWASDV